MTRNEQQAVGIFLVLGLGLVLLLTMKRTGSYSNNSSIRFIPARKPEENKPASIRFIREPEQEAAAYDNEEIREIEYNELGLPKRIVIHRHARVA